MNFKRTKKPEPKVEVKIEEKEVVQVGGLCKAKGCNRYSHTQGFCANCARDLKLL